jgi:hypothetical protein
MDSNYTEEHKARLHRAGLVDARVDCVALLVQEGLHGAGMQRALQQRAAAATGAGGGNIGGNAGGNGAAIVASQDRPLGEGALEGYLACQQWLAQGLDGETLAARIVRRIFAIWPCEAADYQRRYDEFLEKELENPRGTYYLSSSEWMAAVEELRNEVGRARELGQLPSEKAVRRCLKLLLTHSPQPAGAATGTATTLPAGLGGDAVSRQQAGMA